MKSYSNLTPSEKLIELDTFIESSKKTVYVFKQRLLSGYGTPEDAKLLREWENHLWSQQLTRTELIQETKKLEMTKKVFKYNISLKKMVEVGEIIEDSNSFLKFNRPKPFRQRTISLYDHLYFVKTNDSDEYDLVEPINDKQITTVVDGVCYSIGYPKDDNGSVVFYDQYL